MPSDAAFREAVLDLLGFYQPYAGSQGQRDSALARVLALYAEASRGMTPEESAQYKAFLRSRFTPAESRAEVYEVEGEIARAWVRVPFLPGDKVRVTKVEEG